MQANKPGIVLIGAGNLATNLGIALQKKGFPIKQVFSRTLESARLLGERLQTSYTHSLEAILPNEDIYFFALKDSALPEVLQKLPPLNGLYVHTAGSLSLDVFKPYTSRFGVLYPLQTFSKSRTVSFDHLPIFIEASNPSDQKVIETVANSLSDRVSILPSEKRKFLHLAAVFACNFTNHLYHIASGILEEQGISREALLPLIEETTSKIKDLHPQAAQTGPAVRNDLPVMEAHVSLLEGKPEWQEIYRLLSHDIFRAQGS